MRKLLTIVAALVVIIAGAILGYQGGSIFFDVTTYRLPSGEWRQVSLGQEKADRILGARNSHDVNMAVDYYIQTDQGNVYRCQSTRCERVLATEKVISGFDQSCGEPQFVMPQPPGAVRDSFALNPCGLCSGRTSSVILSDGSVWEWEVIGCCEMGCLVYLAYPVCGLGIGLLAGIFIAIFVVIRLGKQRQATRAIGSPFH